MIALRLRRCLSLSNASFFRKDFLSRAAFACNFSTELAEEQDFESCDISERCDANLVYSPYEKIPEGPYAPLYEFVTADWKPHGGHFDEEKIAVVDGTTGMKRTFADYYKTAGSLAGALRFDFGVNESTMVAIYCPNHVDYLPTVLAISLCGAKVTPINPLFTSDELEKILNRSQSSILITHKSKLDNALHSAKNCDSVKHVIVISDDDDGNSVPEGIVDLESLRTYDKSFHNSVVGGHASNSDPFCVPYSSGTTGLPKGVCLTPQNIISNLHQVDIVESPAFGPDQNLITPLPFFHIFAFTVAMLYPAWRGQTIITTSGRFDLETFCRLVEEQKPHRALLVPPILLGLAKDPIVDKYDLSSLECIVSGAAPLSDATEEAVKRKIGCVVKQSWGMSELSPVGCHNPDANPKSGCVGPLVPSTIAKVIDEDGKSLGPGEPGQLLIKGPQVMMGYLNAPEETAKTLSESGWLTTGDIASYDKDGYFSITDRMKELIKVRGFAVAPAELEALLNTNESVADAAVIQVPDEKSGELPRAYIVLKEEAKRNNISEKDIYEWVKERVAPYKRLDGGIIFTDSIPKSPSGKILRRILRDQLEEES